jgi:hypothetical protein
MRRLADAKPDPTTGQNMAISGTTELKFRQTYITHPPQQVAATDGAVTPATAASRE